MKTLRKICLLFLVLLTLCLSSCALGATIIKENDGFGTNTLEQKNPVEVKSFLCMV